MKRSFDGRCEPWLVAGRIALIYLIFSILWIYLGDRVLFALFDDPIKLTRWQTYKGSFFVILSSALIYLLMYHALITLRHEQAKAEQILSSRNAELEQRNKVLKQFNNAVSHELKTPLVTIESCLGMIESTLPMAANPEQAQSFGYARHAARQMNRLLESLLLMFRIDSTRYRADPIAWDTLAQEAVDRLNKRGQLRSASVSIAAGGPLLTGDPDKFVQIWQHLIGNAAKYMGNQPHPVIAVGVEQGDQEKLFYVRDNGIGIEKPYQDRIFDLFDQLEKDTEGMGLGLTLVQRIVDYYGGTIWVESAGKGQGSCFYFTLPDALINTGTTR